MLNHVVLSWEEAKVGLDIEGSGSRDLAFQMGPGHEGEACKGAASRVGGPEKGNRLSGMTRAEGKV